MIYLEYEYRGYIYTVYENTAKGNEPLSWQHKAEQARIDKIIKEEEKQKQYTKEEIEKAQKELENAINLLFMSMGSNLVTLLGAILKKNINRFWINNMSSEIVNVTVVSENYWLYIFILLGIAITTTVAGIVIFKTRDI